MYLPNASNARVPRPKVLSYLLSLTHPTGRHKARFFARFGFRVEAWEELQIALFRQAQTNEIATEEQTPFGLKYTVVGAIGTPDGRDPVVRTVWFIDEGQSIPRFVTAYPAEE